jgi:C-terminal peptidase prc
VESKVKDTDLVYGAIRGMLASLDDPYTRFMDPKAFQGMQDERSGSFGGIGIQIGIKDKQLTVIAPIEDTPAYKAGLKAGDRIMAIDGKPTKDMAEAEAVNLIRGPKGTAVKLTIKKDNAPNTRVVSITRDNIVTKAVKAEPLKDAPEIGYIRLSTFMSNDGSQEFKQALKKLEKTKGLIIDLRGNPGGAPAMVGYLASAFTAHNASIYNVFHSRVGTVSEAPAEWYATPRVDVPVYVLIDGRTGSAAESFAYTLQQARRATIVGEHSGGAANPGRFFAAGHGFRVFVPTGSPVNPISRGNWEGTGVIPDVASSSDDALETALALAGKAGKH